MTPLRGFRGILALATIFLLSAASSFAQSDQPIYTDSLQGGWQNWGWATLDYANPAPVHGGSASVSVTAGAWQAMYVHHDAFDTAPYASLAFWIHGGAGGGQHLQVQALRTGSGQQAFALAPLAANTWQQVTIPLSSLGVAGVADMDGFWIQNATNASAATFYVDDVRLVGIPPPSSVAVGVDAGQVVGQADPRHFGFNTAIWDAALNSATTVARLEDAETKVLRFPGGSLSDEYHWATNTTLGNTWTWATGFDDFASVARSTSAAVFITVNYGSGTPQEAAAWVREANVTLGYGFKYWEIGNENYGDWEHDDQAAPHDPYTYATRAVDYIAQMKAVDPTIKVGVVAVTGEDSYANYTNHPATNPRTGQVHNGWTSVMLATLKSRGVTPDFIIHHRYAQAPGAESDAGLLASSTSWAGEVTGLRQMLADYLGAAAPSVEIICTENNSVYSNPGKQTTSLVNGLFLADSIGQALQTEIRGLVWWALRNSQETGNNNSASLYGWRQYGDYGVLSAESERYPAYYVAKLLKYFARGGEQILRTTSSYALLSAYAARDADGTVALLVINKSPTATLSADVALAGFVPSSNAAVHSYGIPQDEAARTGSGSPDVAASSFTGAASSFSYAFAPYSVTVLSLAPSAPVTATPTIPPTATPPPTSTPTRTPTPAPPTATPTRTPTPLPTATPVPIAYTFESGVQGWQASGRPVTKVASTTAKPFAGKRSLAVTLSANGGSGRAYVANPAAPAGASITFLVWIPANSALVAVQPYVEQGAAGGWTWTGSYVPIASLQPGAWNSFTVTVPANAVVPLAELGVEFFTKSVKWSATAYVDNVGW